MQNASAILRLTLSEFRCYTQFRIEVDDRSVILTGPNGAGKTNILEALSFLSPGRGLKRSKLSEIQTSIPSQEVAGERQGWSLSARIKRENEKFNDVGTARSNLSEKRIVKIDGQIAKSQSSLLEIVSILWLTPAMDRLFSEGSGGRRRFLDRLVLGIEPSHAHHASAYEHAMRERNKLLNLERYDPAWLDVIENNIVHHGKKMIEARYKLLEQLNDACSQSIGRFPVTYIEISDQNNQWLEQNHDDLKLSLKNQRSIDSRAGSMTQGPHRSDIQVHHFDKKMNASQCSTGEQKALLVSILLGQARIQKKINGRAPILLLDEVSAHLDEMRRRSLYDELEALQSQCWMTGTDISLFDGMRNRGQFFHVESAQIYPS